eukprot:4462079-Prymnesium_polylepis.1
MAHELQFFAIQQEVCRGKLLLLGTNAGFNRVLATPQMQVVVPQEGADHSHIQLEARLAERLRCEQEAQQRLGGGMQTNEVFHDQCDDVVGQSEN